MVPRGPLRVPTRASSRFASALDQAQADKIRSNSYRAVCSDVYAEVARNNDYDDHDADDVKNVHGTLRLRDSEKKAAKVSAASCLYQRRLPMPMLTPGALKP